jgi:protein-tyrosine phosphatase
MIPLVDIHCHILPGIDDGPASNDEAIAMCRVAWEDGVRRIVATCHQGGRYQHVLSDQIRTATREFNEQLKQIGLAMHVHPGAEVALSPDLCHAFTANQLMTIDDQRRYLLLEFPRGLSLDFRGFVTELLQLQVTPILAHPERYPDLREDNSALESFIRLGCLTQVNGSSLCGGLGRTVRNCVRKWIERGMVHFVASDGHSPEKRPPIMSEAYGQIREWAGEDVADRLCGLHAMAMLQGKRITPPPPQPARRSWFGWW